VSEPAFRYAVIRAAADLPAGFMPAKLDGRWYDLDTMPMARGAEALALAGGAVAVATERFERRDDGVTARVYEFRP
jgi:hypothetical protein